MQWVSKCLATFLVFLNWVSVPLKAGNTASFCFEIPILVDVFVNLLIFFYFFPLRDPGFIQMCDRQALQRHRRLICNQAVALDSIA